MLFFVFVLITAPAAALEPAEVLVIANGQAAHSVALAHYYMQKRRIPTANLLVLSAPTTEVFSRTGGGKR